MSLGYLQWTRSEPPPLSPLQALELALNFLQDHELDVNDNCIACGFYNGGHFRNCQWTEAVRKLKQTIEEMKK
jgi:hypothetical protein